MSDYRISLPAALKVAVDAARAAGHVMRRNWRSPKTIHSASQHDIKLELDVRCQRLIERRLRSVFPRTPIVGEEGGAGDEGGPWRWVVDPIDGTVNFTYGIPHACVSIALQRADGAPPQRGAIPETAFKTVVGVVFDPFCDELWTAIRGRPARLNGRPVHASDRRKLTEAVISLGFGKRESVLNHLLPAFDALTHRVRKIRIMGSAALALTYVASGRFDAFIESGVRLWDIAAGGLIVECAGGRFWSEPTGSDRSYAICASNGHLHRALVSVARNHSA
ncbi:MAG: inositol monophosphatase [Verrucomicrobia bacterium]|jgi:myo-inositol-1(or 4)-monophosphatase|nr:inositol monophosphatase [Verrucomicrobiota bacterium]